MTWIANNAEGGGEYTITVKDNDFIAPRPLSYEGKNVNIILNGGDAERAISLSSNGVLFTIESGVTLTLGDNITLQELSDNTSELVRVNSGGTLVMNDGSKISGNNKTSSYGGGVYVSNGTFTMNNGTISGNTSSSFGGGVYVSSGTFTQNGGTINGNTASTGGGVEVSGGTFTQSGGTISGNTASSFGGGVYVAYGTFMLSGGTISGNTASYYGGEVYVYGSSGTFTKSGETIYGSDASGTLKNTATSGDGDSYGHAVYISSWPSKIRNNTAGSSVTLDSTVSGTAGGWESGISNTTYSSISGSSTWTLQTDGRRKSPYIGNNSVTKARINFTSIAGASITIQLDVSSELTYDRGFISTLDNSSATYDSGYFEGSVIFGEDSVTISISTTGSHFIDIGYQKGAIYSGGSDCTWFKVIQ